MKWSRSSRPAGSQLDAARPLLPSAGGACRGAARAAEAARSMGAGGGAHHRTARAGRRARRWGCAPSCQSLPAPAPQPPLSRASRTAPCAPLGPRCCGACPLWAPQAAHTCNTLSSLITSRAGRHAARLQHCKVAARAAQRSPGSGQHHIRMSPQRTIVDEPPAALRVHRDVARVRVCRTCAGECMP